jgi:small subunit ribosomal protein S6
LATNVYECMLIFDSNKYAQDMAGVSGTINDYIVKAGGEVLVSRMWNEQKLAYPIGHHRKGTYWLVYFRLDSSKLTEINSKLRIYEPVLRSLTLKVEPRLVEALVAHASGTARVERPAATSEAPVAAAVGAEVEGEE